MARKNAGQQIDPSHDNRSRLMAWSFLALRGQYITVIIDDGVNHSRVDLATQTAGARLAPD